MFWKRAAKRKQSSIKPQSLFEAPRERRNFYRVHPSPEMPVELTIDKQVYSLQDVSAGGAAFKAPDLPNTGLLPAMLQLPDGEGPAPLRVEILRKDKTLVCHCRFLALSQALENRIFRYVLEREKQLIRQSQIE